MMKRIQIRTLMLLVVIAALIVALVAEKRRSAALIDRMQAERDLARFQAAKAAYAERLGRDHADLASRTRAEAARAEGKPASANSP